MGPEGVFQLQRGQAPQPAWESQCQSVRKANQNDCLILAGGGTMQILSCMWNSGPAFYPGKDPGGIMGIYLSSLNAFCGLGECLCPCSLWCLVEGTLQVVGVWGTKAADACRSVPIQLVWICLQSQGAARWQRLSSLWALWLHICTMLSVMLSW